MTTIETLLLFAIGILFSFGIWGMVTEHNAPKITLTEAEWECVRTEPSSHVQMMQVGKVAIPTTVTEMSCVEYRRK